MRKLGIIILVLGIAFSVYAEKVSVERANQVALSQIEKFGAKVDGVKSLHEQKEKGILTTYVVNFEPEGWVIMAADDRAKPVLAYSKTGYFDVRESAQSPEVKYWIGLYKKQMHDVIVNDLDIEKRVEWAKVDDGNTVQLKSTKASVDPLLEVNWNQGLGWNRYCPEDETGPGGHAYVGCVAVAMAQAMSVVKYPERPNGNHRYYHEDYGTLYINYDKEDPYDWESMSLRSSDTENARLLYHCALAVNMDFGADGSGSFSNRIVGGLKKYFDYSAQVAYYSRGDDDVAWKKMLKKELDEGRVIVYAGDPGTGEAGHCFNIDGYDINGYFHFNWGWSGSFNGSFSIDNINPSDNVFNVNQDAVIGIQKPYFGPTDITLSSNSVKEGMPVGTVVGTVEVADESPSDFFTYTEDGGPKFPKGTLAAAFWVDGDSLRTKQVFNVDVKSEYTLNIEVEDSEGNTYKETFTITVIPQSGSATPIASSSLSEINVFYSKLNKQVMLRTEEYSGVSMNVDLFDLRGRRIKTELINNDQSVDVSDLNKGIYIVKVQYKRKSYLKKILIQ